MKTHGVVILSQREPQVGKELVATLEDDDGNLHGQSWQWFRDAGDVTEDSDLTANAVVATHGRYHCWCRLPHRKRYVTQLHAGSA